MKSLVHKILQKHPKFMSKTIDKREESPPASAALSVPPVISSRITSRSMMHSLRSLLLRGCLLFAVGVVFAFVLNLLQIQRNVTKFSSDLIDNLFKSAWWVPPSCGTAAAVIGLLHPIFDKILGEGHKEQQEWANVMKIIAVFIGINYASAWVSIKDFDLLSFLFPTAYVVTGFVVFSAIVGLLYPLFDHCLCEPPTLRRDWSSVMRNVAFFVGINHASAKIEYSNNLQLSLTLAAMSIGLWWLFDRSRSGFGLGVSIAVLATLVTQLLVYYGVYMYTEPDFLYVRSWLPCIFFSGGVTMGNIGRQLAMYDHREKEHHD